MSMTWKSALWGSVALLASFGIAQADVVVSEVTSLDNEYFSNWDQGAKQAAEALGLEYRILTDGGDANKQIEVYQAQLSSGAKIFFGNAQNVGNVKQIAELAKANGATYVGVWDNLPGFHPLDNGDDNYAYATYFAPNDIQNAYVLAKALFDKIGGKGNVVHITGFPGSGAEIARNRGFDKALSEYPDIKVVASQPGNWNQVDSRKVMEDIIVATPQIDAVFGQNDSTGVGAMQALEDAGIKVPVVGLDGNKETLDLIKEGRFFATISFTPQWQAGYALVRAYDVANGFQPSPCERMMYTGAAMITADNVETYMDFLAGDKLPFDWAKMSRVKHPDDWDPQNYVWPIDVADLWSTSELPAGYTLPKAYTEAFDGGCVDTLRKEYEDHYKARIPE